MKNAKETYRKFVNYLNNPEEDGGHWLPNIQRPFVWKEEQIERLFDSILREYPIGTLLIWKTKSTIKRRKFIDVFKKSSKLTDYYVLEDEKQKMLVLDGQQRLQSLFIGLKGSYEGKELCVDILSGDVVAPEDIRYKFKFLKKNEINKPWVKLKDIVFNKKEYDEISEEVKSGFDEPLNDEQKRKVTHNIAKIVRIFGTEENLAYQIVDSVDSPNLYKEDDVVEIFIRANAGGTPLGKSDLLFSLLSSTWDESDERMEELLEELNRTGYRFTRDFVLKTCLTVFGKGSAYNIEKFRDIKTRERIIGEWDKLSKAILDVKDFLYGKTFIKADSIFPSYLVLMPLIYYRFHYGEQWKSAQNISDYILRTSLAGAFSGSPDNLIDKCTKKIDEMKKFDFNEIMGVIRANGRSLEVSKDSILEATYGSKEIHLIFNLWYNFNYQPSFRDNKPQVDHIFPQSKLKGIKIRNSNTGRLDVLKYKQFDRDQIANCMLLTASENGAGGKCDILPEDWFKDKTQEYLDMHIIPKDKDLWKIENFEKFLEERSKMICDKLSNFILKEMI